MGAPTCGVLRVSNGMRLKDSNPSFIWSADSKYLAVPEWTQLRLRGLVQRLAVLSVDQREVRYAPGMFRVLELHSFEDSVIQGIDSPAHSPCSIRVPLAEFGW